MLTIPSDFSGTSESSKDSQSEDSPPTTESSDEEDGAFQKIGEESDDSDEHIKHEFNLDAENGLSREKLRKEITARHPRHPSGRKFGICSTRTGGHSFNQKARHSDISAYGTGIVVYFQTLKYMACLYFLMSILSLPAMILYSKGAKDILDGGTIARFSLGNMG